ncbi:MAG: hypothetical protein VR71_20705 [Roseovarius sp. BRH_c41]|uniref:glycosyltransferase n=1 Tax=Roseovarius sp. BRH_c41 TaxID=1629709 RepID=UPI0005F27302|nr:glycosyltransferase [Roseovarius sp. BRH_c41]KJS40915.1 MAG: hypothetical protein VR71_20705 [Roseovarius sp. BRH_c41]
MYQVGLSFDLNENWIGGSYYIRSLVSAFALLPADEQPMLTLISRNKDSVSFIQEVGYTKLQWVHPDQFHAQPDAFPFDAIFPWADPNQAYRTVSWIPDFQELHLPFYFTDAEIAARRHHHRLRFATSGLVVSSDSVSKDVARFYPGECPNVAVVRFASFDGFDDSKIDQVRTAYGLTGPYVMCANQVWVHKNHILVIKALSLLKTKGVDVTVCFTGNESDYRVTGYAKFLKQMAEEWGVSDNLKFLGFIPRSDQLSLMKGARYVIQPSLFEGWSTVIEDAKAMQQFVVASDLPVHQEQLDANCRFFPRHNPEALAAIMLEFARTSPEITRDNDYADRRRQFGRDMLAAFQRFSNGPRMQGAQRLSASDVAALSDENFASA